MTTAADRVPYARVTVMQGSALDPYLAMSSRLTQRAKLRAATVTQALWDLTPIIVMMPATTPRTVTRASHVSTSTPHVLNAPQPQCPNRPHIRHVQSVNLATTRPAAPVVHAQAAAISKMVTDGFVPTAAKTTVPYLANRISQPT